MKNFINFACVCIGLAAAGCSNSATEFDEASTSKSTQPFVAVSSYPLYAMAHAIVGDAATVNFLCRDIASPQNWKPSVGDIAAIQSADLIMLHGAGYEPWAQNLSLPRSRTVITSSAYATELLQVDGAITHQHGPKGASAASQVAWATWLNPELASRQLEQVELALCKLLPNHKDHFTQRAAVMADQFDTLHARLQVLQGKPAGRSGSISVVADSPNFVYLTSTLQWKMHAIENAGAVGQLAAAVSEFHPRILLFQKNGPAELKKAFVDSKVTAVAIDLCEQEDVETAFMVRMTENVDRLEAAMDELN